MASAALGESRLRQTISRVPAFVWLGLLGIGLFLQLLGALTSTLPLSGLAFLLTAGADWCLSRANGPFAALLRLVCWGEPIRALLRWLLLVVAVGAPVSALVPLSVVIAALMAAAASLWLQQRQPPLHFVPGARRQPPATISYARIYRRGAEWPGPLLALEVVAVGAVLAGLSPWLMPCVAAVALGYGAVALLLAIRLGASTTAESQRLQVRLDEDAPTSVVYLSAGVRQARYLFNQWATALAALPSPPLVLVREANQFATLSPTTGTVIYAPTTRQVEAAFQPPASRFFYLANGQKNGDLWRDTTVKHVFLGHGDSDKATSASPIARIYDQIWVAGPAAIRSVPSGGARHPGVQLRRRGPSTDRVLACGPDPQRSSGGVIRSDLRGLCRGHELQFPRRVRGTAHRKAAGPGPPDHGVVPDPPLHRGAAQRPPLSSSGGQSAAAPRRAAAPGFGRPPRREPARISGGRRSADHGCFECE